MFAGGKGALQTRHLRAYTRAAHEFLHNLIIMLSQTPAGGTRTGMWRIIRTHTPEAYNKHMFTVATTERFESDAAGIWSEAEIEELIASISKNPLQGDLIPSTGGLRKLRWARAGMGKRGGARVITYVINADGKVWLLTAYAKAALDNLSAAALVKLRKELIHD